MINICTLARSTGRTCDYEKHRLKEMWIEGHRAAWLNREYQMVELSYTTFHYLMKDTEEYYALRSRAGYHSVDLGEGEYLNNADYAQARDHLCKKTVNWWAALGQL